VDRRSAVRCAAAIALGGLAYGVPYLVLYFLPNYDAIRTMVQSTQAGGSVAESWRAHAAEYSYWALNHAGNLLLSLPFTLGIPLVLLSTPALLALPSTRGLALAALPLQLFVLLFARHKHAYYFVHEIALYTAAAAAWLPTGAELLIGRLRLVCSLCRPDWNFGDPPDGLVAAR